MIINKLYKTVIDCTNNNWKWVIDDTKTITITLLDFNDEPVVDTEVTLTVDKGYFGDDTSAVSFTGTTDVNGSVSVLYHASKWGFVTFTCNDCKVQALVTGWKKVQEINRTDVVGKIYVYSDGRYARVEYNVGNAITPNADNAPFDKNIGSVNSKYYPAMEFVSVTATPTSPYVCNAYLSKSNGYIHINKFQGASSSSVYVRVNMFYPLENTEW